MRDEASGTSSYGQHIEKIRSTELPDLINQVYLDSSGQPRAPRSVLNAVHDRLCNGPMISNPHSSSPSGLKTKEEIDEVRSLVCEEVFRMPRRGGRLEMDPDAQERGWELVFTSGATASLQDVARYLDFNGRGRFAYLEQSHSSLLGLRDIVTRECRDKGADGCDVLQEEKVIEWVKRRARSEGVSLLALPLQCNATGKRYNELVSAALKAREELESNTSQRKVYILLDAASYLSPSSNLPLKAKSCHQPDFVCFSFLKILGYPSGLGGLLILRGSASVLLSGKQYYGGGTLEAVTSRQHWKQPAREIKEAFEDGTQNLFGITAVKNALKVLRSKDLLKGWDQASDYVDDLTRRLWDMMSNLRHSNGSPVVKVYSSKPVDWSDSPKEAFHLPQQSQGPILLFNVMRSISRSNHLESRLVDPAEVDRLACVENIHLRSGRMCNVGAITKALELDEGDIKKLWERGIGCGSVVADSNRRLESDEAEEERLKGLVSGCIRVSLSAWNTLDDLDQLIHFLRKYFVVETEADCEYQYCEDGCESVDSCNSSSESSQATSDTSHSVHDEAESEHYLKDLHLYPIKSCACQALSSGEKWKLTPTGLQYDRQFCIVDIANGKVMSQKQCAKMARIRPTIRVGTQMLEILLIDDDEQEETELSVSLNSIEAELKDQQRGYDMCGKTLHPSLYTSKAISGPLSAFLGRDCTLGRYPDGKLLDDRTPLLFSNESPFLLITSESVKQVCHWIEEEEEKQAQEDRVSLAFRSNFILSSSSSANVPFYEEKNIRRVSIGPFQFAVMGPCRRCQMIALDQINGRPAPEILTVVARHCRCQEGKYKSRLLFGLHLMWLQQENSTDVQDFYIHSGMPVTLHH
jgi:molybdenum cofactor sulfurtransferase